MDDDGIGHEERTAFDVGGVGVEGSLGNIECAVAIEVDSACVLVGRVVFEDAIDDGDVADAGTDGERGAVCASAIFKDETFKHDVFRRGERHDAEVALSV